jgi:hypothetical protein
MSTDNFIKFNQTWLCALIMINLPLHEGVTAPEDHYFNVGELWAAFLPLRYPIWEFETRTIIQFSI